MNEEKVNDALKLYHEGNVKESEDALRTLLNEFPKAEDVYEALSVILYNQERYDEAIEVLKKWVRINPDAIMSHTNLSRCYVAKEMIPEAEHEQAEARRLSWKAELQAKKAEQPEVDHEAQIEKFKKVVEFDPNDVLGYFTLGSAYIKAGKKREALDTFEKAIAVDPKHSSSYVSLGNVLEDLQDFAKAKRIYQKGIEVASDLGDMIPLRKMEARLKHLFS